MRLKPRSLFRPRVRGPVLHIGPDTARGSNYMPAILELARDVRAPGVYQVEVHHDDRCGIFAGGRCNCRPTATLAGNTGL